MNDEDIHSRLDTLLEQQQELLMLTRAIHTKLPLADVKASEEEVWLTRIAVMDLLCITQSTFYRRQAEEKWTRKKSGGTWYYLKSSLINKS